MSPYVVTAQEVVARLGHTDERRAILRGWLEHRAALRAVGFDRGLQWVDGSFVEVKIPGDIDVVGFFHRPAALRTAVALDNFMDGRPDLFDRSYVKPRYRVDYFPVDLNGRPETLVNLTRYWMGLFSHRRADGLWKGMLQVRVEDVADDAAALVTLGPAPAAPVVAGGAP